MVRHPVRWGLAAVALLLLAFIAPTQAKEITPWQGPTDADSLLKSSSGNWAAPRCIGNGTSGPRVQPVFVYRAGQVNRFEQFRVALQRSLYLTSGIFERSSKSQRAVRWVHDAACQPVIWQVAVPEQYTYNLSQLRSYLTGMDPRFRSSKRVYSLWVDAYTSPNWSGLGDKRWSASWTSSYGFIWVDAHELVHALGAVHPSAPHATGKGHCWDGYDVMCYSDGGSGWRKATMCLSPQAHYRLDCNKDDYFSIKPRRGSWLKKHPKHNVANSRFLEKTLPVALPSPPPAPTNASRTLTSVDWDSVPGVRYDVGYTAFSGERVWVAQDVLGGHVDLVDVSLRTRIFVRAVNDAGYSPRVYPANR
jgi:hypothetical protein